MKNVWRIFWCQTMRSVYICGICTIVAALLLLFFSSSTSPLFAIDYSDGIVFKYVALGMIHGKVPYVDVFDNKGIFLYFINYIGLLLDRQYGVLVLQLINLSLFFYLVYRLCLLLKASHCLTIVIPILATFVLRFLGDGDLTEEWSLVLITIPLFFILPLYTEKKESLTNNECIILGLCLGLLTLLRANNIAPLLGLMSIWFAQSLISRKYQLLSKFILLVSIGFSIPILLSCVYIYYKSGVYGVKEMYYATIVVNFDFYKYQVTAPSEVVWWKELPAVFLCFLIACMCLVKGMWRRNPSLCLSLILSILFSLLSTGQLWYPHYQMLTVPILAVILALFTKYRMRVALILLLVTSGFLCKYSLIRMRHYIDNKAEVVSFQQEFASCIEMIPEEERTEIWNYNVTIFKFADVAYLNSIFPVNRIDRPQFTGYEDPLEDFVLRAPKWVIADESLFDESQERTRYLLHNYYRIARIESNIRSSVSIYQSKKERL